MKWIRRLENIEEAEEDEKNEKGITAGGAYEEGRIEKRRKCVDEERENKEREVEEE